MAHFGQGAREAVARNGNDAEFYLRNILKFSYPVHNSLLVTFRKHRFECRIELLELLITRLIFCSQLGVRFSRGGHLNERIRRSLHAGKRAAVCVRKGVQRIIGIDTKFF